MKKQGFVYIVGAGPGAPDLITVKGRRCVRRADVILHDRLIHPDLLREARQNAVLVDAGKRFGHEDQQQAEIHNLMIQYAREGSTVCLQAHLTVAGVCRVSGDESNMAMPVIHQMCHGLLNSGPIVG